MPVETKVELLRAPMKSAELEGPNRCQGAVGRCFVFFVLCWDSRLFL